MSKKAPAQSRKSLGIDRRGVLRIAALAVVPMLAPAATFAQDAYPSRPIKLIVPYGTGGVSDTVGRLAATALGKAMNATVVVENRGGAGGTVGGAVAAKAAPDGYTLLLTSPPMTAVAPALLKDLPYNPGKDLMAIGTIITTPNILVVNHDLPAKNIGELIGYAKGAGKGKLSFASAGPGSTGHLSGHILQTATGIDMQHIPYKSSGLAFPDVISGRVSMVFDSLPSTIGHVRSGKVRPILVMSEKRSSILPDVPTAAESGFPAATMNFWMGIEGPAGIPAPIVSKLSAGIKAAVATKEMSDQISHLGGEMFFTTPSEFAALRKADIEKYGKLVKEMGLKQD